MVGPRGGLTRRVWGGGGERDREVCVCLQSGPLYAPALLPARTPILHMSAPVRRGAVAEARLGLA